MLGGVIHLKSRPAETSKRTLRGMVEGQVPRETTLYSVDIQRDQEARLRWGTCTNNRVSQMWART